MQRTPPYDSPEDVLQHVYGYDHFRGQQREIIDSAVNGQDVLVLMPTGGGKSLCYQIPMLLGQGMGLVVSPLIALMQDQVSALQQLGVRAAFLNSTLSAEEKRRIASDLYAGEMDVLYIAPERLLQPNTLSWIQQFDISLIAIDEAHCVSQWGHDFRQDYLQLYQLKDAFPGVSRMALTATATPRSQQEIVHNLQLDNPKKFVSSFDRPNILYKVAPKEDVKKQLIRFVKKYKGSSGVVYCLSRKKVESFADWLQQRGFVALPYHAGLPAKVRAENQARFLREDAVIMVATVAFGMGIDKPDVRFVVHLDLPSSMEAYYQETGRAGRDGEPAEAWMVYGLNDVVQRFQMVEQSQAADEYKRNERAKLDALLGWCEVTTCRRIELLRYFGEVLETPCGNCDTCLQSPTTWDATEAAQKLLSCVYRTGQRFGAGHVIDVLRGKVSERMTQLGHDTLSTYGIGKILTQDQWRSIVRQLMVRGFIFSDPERYGALILTESSRALLKGEFDLLLREDVAEAKTAHNSSQGWRRGDRMSEDRSRVADEDRALWNALRACRKELADEQGIPPYMVFHDATLMEIMEQQPTKDYELLHINGVGEAKLERFGDAFLEVVKQYVR